jgi:hypothetical protein
LPVVAERGVEPGLLTDVTVDDVGLGVVVVIEEGQVGLQRGNCLSWQRILGVGAEDGLTPDHDDVGLVGYLGCGAQEVGKLLAVTSSAGAGSRGTRRALARARPR